MEKIYRVQMNSKGMPNFSTAVEVAGRPQEWIPCSERLPKDGELALITYIDPRPKVAYVWIGWHEMDGVWYIDGEVHSNELGNEVIAWMPLPKPWKGADDER